MPLDDIPSPESNAPSSLIVNSSSAISLDPHAVPAPLNEDTIHLTTALRKLSELSGYDAAWEGAIGVAC